MPASELFLRVLMVWEGGTAQALGAHWTQTKVLPGPVESVLLPRLFSGQRNGAGVSAETVRNSELVDHSNFAPTFLYPLNLTHSTHSTPKRLRCARKEVEKGVGRPQVVGGKSSMCAMRPATGPGTRLLAGRSEAAAATSGSRAPRVSTSGTQERQWKSGRKGGQVAPRSTELLGCTGWPGWWSPE